MHRNRTRRVSISEYVNGPSGAAGMDVSGPRPANKCSSADLSPSSGGESLWEVSEGGAALKPRNGVAKIVLGNITIDGSGSSGIIRIMAGSSSITITPNAIGMDGSGSVSIEIQAGKDIALKATDACENGTQVSKLFLRE